MHQKNFIIRGKPLTSTSKVLILIHGRGATAEDIFFLADQLHTKDFTLIAPQAIHNTWYPYSFLAPPSQNEPWLSSAVGVVHDIVIDIMSKGITSQHIYFTGFSQGACLMLDYVCRHAMHYGGIAAFTGGLIGDHLYPENYKGDFDATPVFIGSSDPDSHVPVERVNDTTAILKEMNASVTSIFYKNMGHTICPDEISKANTLIFKQ